MGILKLELNRAFANRDLLISLLIGLAITLSHIFFWVIPNSIAWEENVTAYGWSKTGYPFSLYNTWIGGQGHTLQPTLYATLIPLLACIPFAASFYSDRASGYSKLLVTRAKMGEYYFAKAVSVFLSAGFVVVIPLMTNFLLTALFFPAIIPENTTATFPISPSFMWGELFFSHPLVYNGLYMLLIFLYAGLFGILSLVISYVLRNMVFVLLTPFILCMFADFILGAIAGARDSMLYQFSPQSFLRPDQAGGADFMIVAGEFLVIFISSVLFLIYRSRRDDVL